MNTIEQYHLHRNDYAQLHFELREAAPYCQDNIRHCFKPHRHSFHQLIWFKTAGRHFVDYEMIDHPANAIFFLNPGQVHYFCEQSENEGYLFHFNDIFLHKQAEQWRSYALFNDLSHPCLIPHAAALAEITRLTSLMTQELKHQEYNFRQQVYFLFQATLLTVERLKQKQPGSGGNTQGDFKLVKDFQALIGQNMDKFCSINEYSKLLGVSSKKLTALTKAYGQDTPANMVHARKILEAKRLLSNTTLSIKEIAYALGFDEPTYFTKYFKKHTHLTPTDFIKHLP